VVLRMKERQHRGCNNVTCLLLDEHGSQILLASQAPYTTTSRHQTCFVPAITSPLRPLRLSVTVRDNNDSVPLPKTIFSGAGRRGLFWAMCPHHRSARVSRDRSVRQQSFGALQRGQVEDFFFQPITKRLDVISILPLVWCHHNYRAHSLGRSLPSVTMILPPL
jgi:hypothetical protein